MDRYRAMRLSGEALVLAGILMMAWAALEGQVSFALVLIVPVLYGTGPLAAAAFLSIFIGMTLVFLSFFKAVARTDAAAPESAKREWGGVILIGPIPIIIGSAGMLKGRKAIALLAILSVIVLLLFLLSLLR